MKHDPDALLEAEDGNRLPLDAPAVRVSMTHCSLVEIPRRLSC